MVIFQNFSLFFFQWTSYVLYIYNVIWCVTDIGLLLTSKINIRISQFEKKNINFQKKTFKIFTFSKNAHTCTCTWILMGSIFNIYRNARQKNPPRTSTFFRKWILKFQSLGFFLGTFYRKVYWVSRKNFRIFKFDSIIMYFDPKKEV